MGTRGTGGEPWLHLLQGAPGVEGLLDTATVRGSPGWGEDRSQSSTKNPRPSTASCSKKLRDEAPRGALRARSPRKRTAPLPAWRGAVTAGTEGQENVGRGHGAELHGSPSSVPAPQAGKGTRDVPSIGHAGKGTRGTCPASATLTSGAGARTGKGANWGGGTESSDWDWPQALQRGHGAQDEPDPGQLRLPDPTGVGTWWCSWHCPASLQGCPLSPGWPPCAGGVRSTGNGRTGGLPLSQDGTLGSTRLGGCLWGPRGLARGPASVAGVTAPSGTAEASRGWRPSPGEAALTPSLCRWRRTSVAPGGARTLGDQDTSQGVC